MQLEVKCELQCAHKLSCVASESKCRRLHGHTYYVKVGISGSIPRPSQVMVDIDVVRKVIVDSLDHYYLNERLSELGYDGEPTLENLSTIIREIVRKVLPQGVQLSFVEVQEGSGATLIL